MDRIGERLNNRNIGRGRRFSPDAPPPARRPPVEHSEPAMALHLPTYLLYGEDAGLPPEDVMHSESIAERSALHSWEIKPHRHESLLQVFWFEKGEVEILI